MIISDVCAYVATLNERELLAIRDYIVALNDLKYNQPHFLEVAMRTIKELEKQDVN